MLHQITAQITAQITECKTYKDMIDIQELKNEITDTIKSNGRGEITAEKEQRILLKVADAIAERASQEDVNSLAETIEDVQSEIGDCVTESQLSIAIAEAITQTLNTAV